MCVQQAPTAAFDVGGSLETVMILMMTQCNDFK